MMTPLAILQAAMTGQPAPRIPVFCNLLDQGARELGLAPQVYFSNGEYVAEAQLKMRVRFGYDNVWSLFYVGKETEFFGCHDILFAEDGPPNVADFVIKNYDDIAKLAVPDDITAHPAWEQTARCLKVLQGEVGATHPICAYLTASNTLPVLLMGLEKWLELLLLGPFDVRDELMRKCSLFFQQQCAAYRAAGANVLVYSAPFGSDALVGMKRFRDFSLPWMQADLAAGVDNVVFYCGMEAFNRVIPDVMQTLGIGAYYISPLADLAEAKGLIGNQGLTCGVIDDISLIRWDHEQIRAEVKRLCDIGKPGGHFLFGTGLMPLAIPEANIHSLIAAAFEYGTWL